MAPGGYWAKGLLGHYLARQGDVSGARDVLDELLTRQQTAHVQMVALAAIYVGLGDEESALGWLEKAAAQPGGLWFWIPNRSALGAPAPAPTVSEDPRELEPRVGPASGRHIGGRSRQARSEHVGQRAQ